MPQIDETTPEGQAELWRIIFRHNVLVMQRMSRNVLVANVRRWRSIGLEDQAVAMYLNMSGVESDYGSQWDATHIAQLVALEGG